MLVPIVKCRVSDGRFAPTPAATHHVECFHGDDPQRLSYGTIMYNAWKALSDAPGVVWVEGDIAVEPLHLEEMRELYNSNPESVVAVPFRLYPASTHLDTVTWPFYTETQEGGERILRADEPLPAFVRSFGLGCTYLPAGLFLELGKSLCEWDWPSLDWRLSVAAREAKIKIMTTRTPAVHLHY